MLTLEVVDDEVGVEVLREEGQERVGDVSDAAGSLIDADAGY